MIELHARIINWSNPCWLWLNGPGKASHCEPIECTHIPSKLGLTRIERNSIQDGDQQYKSWGTKFGKHSLRGHCITNTDTQTHSKHSAYCIHLSTMRDCIQKLHREFHRSHCGSGCMFSNSKHIFIYPRAADDAHIQTQNISLYSLNWDERQNRFVIK